MVMAFVTGVVVTVFERQGHKLIVGNGFVWDVREEKLYGDPKNALGGLVVPKTVMKTFLFTIRQSARPRDRRMMAQPF